MSTIIYILIATFIISLGGLLGVFTLFINKHKLERILYVLVSISAGSLIGGAFLHLLPEAVETVHPEPAFLFVLIAFVFFFFLEKLLYWRHCHQGKCEAHNFGYLNLVGDGLHNLIDGLIIAAAYQTSISLGIATTVAVAFHEIPQEIGDFGVLLYAGFTKTQALYANFLVALTSVLGGLIGYFASSQAQMLTPYIHLLAVGSFLYIAASDLIPEIRQQPTLKSSVSAFMAFILGILIMYLLKYI